MVRDKAFFLPLLLCALVLGSCTFNYGEAEEEDTGPDIVMNRVEYVRVREGDPQVRFRADLAERWEKRQVMELQEFSFEQFEDEGEEINSHGSAEKAHVELDSGNIEMTGGVHLEIESEDFTIDTATLRWRDGERELWGDRDAPVDIQRSDGTFFQGRGFSADVRKRSWTFTGAVEGSYVYEDDEEGGEDDAGY